MRTLGYLVLGLSLTLGVPSIASAQRAPQASAPQTVSARAGGSCAVSPRTPGARTCTRVRPGRG